MGTATDVVSLLVAAIGASGQVEAMVSYSRCFECSHSLRGAKTRRLRRLANGVLVQHVTVADRYATTLDGETRAWETVFWCRMCRRWVE